MTENLSVVILAAGKSSRFFGGSNKLLAKVGGVPVLTRVLKAAIGLNPSQILVVYSSGQKDPLSQAVHVDVNWVEQGERRGTGAALSYCLPYLQDSHQTLVLCADHPFFTSEILGSLLNYTSSSFLTAHLENPCAMGRVVRGESGFFEIVEQSEATLLQQEVKEVFVGAMSLDSKALNLVDTIKPNAKNDEYYLTQIPRLLFENNLSAHIFKSPFAHVCYGVNTESELEFCENYLRKNYKMFNC